MEQRKIKCYLCETDAVEETGFDTALNLRVNCAICKYYLLTDGAMKFYIKRPDSKQILTKEDKEKLRMYIMEKYDPKKHEPIWIATKVIEAVTGKKSVHERY